MLGQILGQNYFRIRAQIVRPDLGPVWLPPNPPSFPSPLSIHTHLVAHLLININLRTSYISVFIRKNILNSSLTCSKSSETYRHLCFSASHGFTKHFLFHLFETLLLCFLLRFVNCNHAAITQRAPIFFLSVSLLLPILFFIILLYFM